MTAKTIALELTQGQASVCLEAMITERRRFWRFIDRCENRGESLSSENETRSYILDYLVHTLRIKTGCW